MADSQEGGNGRPRIAYFSVLGGVHDERFLRKIGEEEGQSWFVTIAPEVSSRFQDIPGIEVVNLHSPLWPLDDPANDVYPLRMRLRLGLGLLVYARRLRSWLKRNQPDVLHASWLPTAGYAAALTGFRPLVMMPWGSDVLLVPDRWQGRARKRIRRALAAADAVVCESAHVQRAVETLDPRVADTQMVQFPRGVDLQLFHPRDGPESRSAALQIRTAKGLIANSDFSTLLQAIALLGQRGIDVEATLLGEGGCREALEREARELGISDRIRLPGAASPEEVAVSFREADVFVSCALSEGAGVALMEAMASGLPVIVSDVPCYRQWVEAGVHGSIFARGNPSELADCLGAIATDEELAASMRRAAHAAALVHFDWEVNYAKLHRLYARLGQAATDE